MTDRPPPPSPPPPVPPAPADWGWNDTSDAGWQPPSGNPLGSPADTGWQPPPQPPRHTNRRWWIIGGTVVGLALLATVAVGLGALGGAYGLFEGWEDWDAWDEPWGWGADTIPVGPGSEIATLDVPVGACATTDDPLEPTVVRQVDCTQVHELEFYEAATLVQASGLTLSELAADVCEPAFARFVGAAYSRSQYDYVAFVPDRVRFDAGEREVTCAIRSWGGDERIGSVAGSRR